MTKDFLKEFLIHLIENALEKSPLFKECVEQAQRQAVKDNPFAALQDAIGDDQIARRKTILPPPPSIPKKFLN